MPVFDKTGKISFGPSNKGSKKGKRSENVNFFSGSPKKTKKVNSGDESRSEVRKMQKNKEYVRSHTSGKKKVYSGLKKSPTSNLLFGGSEIFHKKRD